MQRRKHKGMCVSTHRNTHTHSHLQWEVFEWQVVRMAVSDCADNGILVSLQIVPQEMAENCFWIKVKEEKLENPDLFAQLSLTFSSQSKGKEAPPLLSPSLINLPTRFIWLLQRYMSGHFRFVTFKDTNFLTSVLIILRPGTFSATIKRYSFSQLKSLCQLVLPWLLLQWFYGLVPLKKSWRCTVDAHVPNE